MCCEKTCPKRMDTECFLKKKEILEHWKERNNKGESKY